MRRALVSVSGASAGILEERELGKDYVFEYNKGYAGPPVSLTMPLKAKVYRFDTFPPYFEGALPEGLQLEALLKQKKLDQNDLFSQLIAVGKDLIGAVSVVELPNESE